MVLLGSDIGLYYRLGGTKLIDIHSHILYGLDDGAKTVKNSLEMAREAVNQGIKVIYATPHHLNGVYENNAEEIRKAVLRINQLFHNHSINLDVRVGQEIRINGNILEDLQNGSSLTLGDQGIYVLIEFPSKEVPRYTNNLLFDLQVEGFKPIIVHPERNSEIIQKPSILYELVKNGALTQVTAASVAGKFGKKIQRFSLDLIEHHLTHFIASDAHNITTRSFWMNEAFEVIQNTFGIDIVFYLKENAQLLLDNEIVIGEPPHRIKQKKLFGLF